MGQIYFLEAQPTPVQRGTTTLEPSYADADAVQAEGVVNQDAERSRSLGRNGPKKASRSVWAMRNRHRPVSKTTPIVRERIL
jgi:hypothetical protein